MWFNHNTAIYGTGDSEKLKPVGLPYQIWHLLYLWPTLFRAAKYFTSHKTYINRCYFLHLQHCYMTFFAQIKY